MPVPLYKVMEEGLAQVSCSDSDREGHGQKTAFGGLDIRGVMCHSIGSWETIFFRV